MTDVLLTETTQILTVVDEAAQILTVADEIVQILAVAEQGPPGPPGKNGDGNGALLIDNRLNEFAGNTDAQAQAQANLGLGVADPLAYYILAKA